jgi:hypothetical protein
MNSWKTSYLQSQHHVFIWPSSEQKQWKIRCEATMNQNMDTGCVSVHMPACVYVREAEKQWRKMQPVCFLLPYFYSMFIEAGKGEQGGREGGRQRETQRLRNRLF